MSITATATAIRTWPAFTAASLGLGAVAVLLANYSPTHPDLKAGAEPDSIVIIAGVYFVAAAIALAVFLTAVRTATPENASRRSLIIALASVPTVVAFWSALPIMLTGAVVATAVGHGKPTRSGVVALVIAAGVAGVSLWGCVYG